MSEKHCCASIPELIEYHSYNGELISYILIICTEGIIDCRVTKVFYDPRFIKISISAGGLACRLKCPPGRSKPPTAGLSHGKWEVDPTELTLMEELGSGQFGVVRRAKWKGNCFWMNVYELIRTWEWKQNVWICH